MFEASARILPLGESAASITACPGVSVGVTNFPVPQSAMFGENGFFDFHWTMPWGPGTVGLGRGPWPNARIVLPLLDQWMAWPMLMFPGTGLHVGALSPDLPSEARQRAFLVK